MRAEAVEHWRAAVQINPQFADALNNLGCALRHRDPDMDDATHEEQLDEAVKCFRAAIEAIPNHADAHSNLGLTLWQLKQPEAALEQLRTALRLQPNHIDANVTYARYLCEMAEAEHKDGKKDEAAAHLREALPCLTRVIRLDAQNARAFETLGRVRQLQEKHQEAVQATSTAAWLMATSANAMVRDGRKAVELAAKLVHNDGGREPKSLDILAAAHAEAGDFAKAVENEKKAVELAAKAGHKPLAAAMRQRLALYERRQPFRETPKTKTR